MAGGVPEQGSERGRRGTGVLVALAALLLAACAPIRQEPETPRMSPEPAADSASLGAWLDSVPEAREGATGFRLLAFGGEAYEWRLSAARAAEERLHVQYYIWQDDAAGRALIAELLAAADRGVDVSMLLDDMDVRGDDRSLAILDSHPNVSVRVFNPFRSRWGVLRAGVEFVFRGSHLNHRMHNKAWIADGQLAIIGGRNIGDEYFDAGETYNFSDLDVAMAGRLALEADHAFVCYWNSPAAIPVQQIRRVEKEAAVLEAHRTLLDDWMDTHREDHPLLGLAQGERGERLRALQDEDGYTWTSDAELVVDDAAKGLGEDTLEPGVIEVLLARYAGLERELVLISPYFVPGAEGTALLVDLVDRGVDVGVLTNSLAATDVAFAHSGYARRRQALLEGGVTLHELRPSAWSSVQSEYGSGLGLGSSRASLHSKAQLLDGEEVFIGSFNLDPRSANINTEMGVFVADPTLVRELRQLYDASVEPALAYRVTLDDGGRVQWLDGDGTRYTRDPKAGFWRRFGAGAARLLPIESQL
ncbi:phospholipase D family protein [Aquisalimonas sp.]|uniref:phospholipase D family protein n=1 Tax=Aquisalimonas sp. TaxID=1872621 RepID=UPI0025BEBB0D|nr:phospholipase D family protein [Aquisalimonas sp.]